MDQDFRPADRIGAHRAREEGAVRGVGSDIVADAEDGMARNSKLNGWEGNLPECSQYP
jgi:hypothetical protein